MSDQPVDDPFSDASIPGFSNALARLTSIAASAGYRVVDVTLSSQPQYIQYRQQSATASASTGQPSSLSPPLPRVIFVDPPSSPTLHPPLQHHQHQAHQLQRQSQQQQQEQQQQQQQEQEHQQQQQPPPQEHQQRHHPHHHQHQHQEAQHQRQASANVFPAVSSSTTNPAPAASAQRPTSPINTGRPSMKRRSAASLGLSPSSHHSSATGNGTPKRKRLSNQSPPHSPHKTTAYWGTVLEDRPEAPQHRRQRPPLVGPSMRPLSPSPSSSHNRQPTSPPPPTTTTSTTSRPMSADLQTIHRAATLPSLQPPSSSPQPTITDSGPIQSHSAVHRSFTARPSTSTTFFRRTGNLLSRISPFSSQPTLQQEQQKPLHEPLPVPISTTSPLPPRSQPSAPVLTPTPPSLPLPPLRSFSAGPQTHPSPSSAPPLLNPQMHPQHMSTSSRSASASGVSHAQASPLPQSPAYPPETFGSTSTPGPNISATLSGPAAASSPIHVSHVNVDLGQESAIIPGSNVAPGSRIGPSTITGIPGPVTVVTPHPPKRGRRPSAPASGPGVTLHKCDFCSTNFRRKSDKTRHIRVVHEKSRPFECDICRKSFGEKSNMLKHRASVHEHVRIFRCMYCKEIFVQRSLCDAHVRDVHKKKQAKYFCEHCGLPFSRKIDRQEHYRTEHPNVLKSHQAYEADSASAEAVAAAAAAASSRNLGDGGVGPSTMRGVVMSGGSTHGAFGSGPGIIRSGPESGFRQMAGPSTSRPETTGRPTGIGENSGRTNTINEGEEDEIQPVYRHARSSGIQIQRSRIIEEGGVGSSTYGLPVRSEWEMQREGELYPRSRFRGLEQTGTRDGQIIHRQYGEIWKQEEEKHQPQQHHLVGNQQQQENEHEHEHEHPHTQIHPYPHQIRHEHQPYYRRPQSGALEQKRAEEDPGQPRNNR